MTNRDEVRPIQAPNNTEARRKSDTENARMIAAHFGWTFNEADNVVDATGNVVAFTIEDVAEAMIQAGWILPNIWRTDWTAIPQDETVASALLQKILNKNGKYGGRWP